MNFTFEIAKRYIFGKKSTSAINIITWISITGITIGTAALILILSVFNGLESLISGMYNSFNPDMKILPKEGKYFDADSSMMHDIYRIKGVTNASRTIEEFALFEYKDVQKGGKIKGVDNRYQNVTSIDSTMRRGKFTTRKDKINYGVLGKGLGANLSINYKDALSPISVYMPTRGKRSVINQLGKEFKSISVYPSGSFAVGSEADVEYLITNITAVTGLLTLDDTKTSSIELRISSDVDEDEIREAIFKIVGKEDFIIENRYEQDAEILKTMNIEKWISYLIVMLTLVLIAFNMVSCLWMMVLEKRKDISILRSMGYDTQSVRRIFIMEGIIITGIGVIIGVTLALILYFLQKEYGLVGIPDGFMMTAYPVELKATDFLVSILTVFAIGWLASLLPAYRAGLVSAFVREEVN